MTYKYKFVSSSSSLFAQTEKDTKNQYIEIFQKSLDDQFYNSSDWWTIGEESIIGSETYSSIDVRINHTINSETGLKLGDDWKTILFKDITHPVEVGKKYSFDDNIWITISTEVIKNLTATCTVRRCNNTLRWIDEPTGAIYIEPCIIEYLVKEPRDYATQGSPFMTPGGFIKIYTQFNQRTAKINQNQRFLFGNKDHWTCYKVIGTGINDFRNIRTYDNSRPQLIVLDMIANFTNEELDDFENGIADAFSNLYSITLNKTQASGSPGSTISLIPTILYNGNNVSRPVKWISSSGSIATVDENGNVTLLAEGNCIITAQIVDNPALATCQISSVPSPTPNNEIRISPNKNYILEGNQVTYSVYKYVNDVAQLDTFTFTCNPNDVPSSNYIFVVNDGNHFTISNSLRDVSSHLTITCSAIGNPALSKDFDIYLRGAWLYDTI
jgi:hypothetical protein